MPTVHFVSRKLLGEVVGQHGLPWEVTGINKKPKTFATTSSASAGEASSTVAAANDASTASPPAQPESSNSKSPSEGKIYAHESCAKCRKAGCHGCCLARCHKSSCSEKSNVDEKCRKHAATFLVIVDALKAYKEKHGHFRVLRKEDRNLYDFCYRVRRARRELGVFCTTKLTEERIEALDAIGFDWEMQRVVPLSGALSGSGSMSTCAKNIDDEKDHKRAATFLDRIEALKAYKEKHGHFRVLPKEDRSLYDFCYRVRRARSERGKFGTTKLSVQGMAALDSIGFDWEMQRVVPPSETLSGPGSKSTGVENTDD